MSRYSAAVALQLGLEAVTVETILYASSMHDLGKLGIPDAILLKPSKLDPVEWEVMKQHTTIGADILKGSEATFLQLGETIAKYHHEKWDGSGYPHHLEGEAIPLVARIAAIADVFDALTSERPYKAAYTIERSLEIIAEGRGTHFDPQVVDAFFAIEAQIRAIKAEFDQLEM
jgi:putative two-component system response regulator